MLEKFLVFGFAAIALIAAYKSLNDDEQAECDRLINELEGSQQTPGAIGEIIAQILLRRVL